MVLEFYDLYHTVCYYQKSVCDNLKKVDEKLLQVINESSRTQSRYRISIAMLALLERYIKIKFLSETTLEELETKLNDLDCYDESERELTREELPRHETVENRQETCNQIKYNTWEETRQPSKTSESETVVVEVTLKNNASILNSSMSDTETLVDFANETDRQETAHFGVKLQPPEVPPRPIKTLPEVPPRPIKTLPEVPLRSIKTPSVCEMKEKGNKDLSSDFEDIEDIPVRLLINDEEEDEVKKDPMTLERGTTQELRRYEKIEPKQETFEAIANHEISSPKLDYNVLMRLLNVFIRDRLKEAEKTHVETYSQPLELIRILVPKIGRESVEKPITFELEDDVLRKHKMIEKDLTYQARLEEVVKEEREIPFGDDDDEEATTGEEAQDELEHAKLSEDGITTDKTLNLSLPEVGEEIDILITGYKTTCHFYAQIIRNSDNEEFLKLLENMNAKYIVQSYIQFKLYPAVGEIIIAKHKQWLRARCIHRENYQVSVFLVDFGMTVVKKMAEIRKMKDDFLYLPFQAVECILDGVTEREDTPLLKSWGFFENDMKFRPFKAEVLETENTGQLRLKMYDATGVDMRYVLQNRGLV